ncbi:MAG: hypothetical protein CM1200mP30_03610 [Pseudomonadota bacterium]|nr:MAG: hypothetical protein CM1200mP30_03610 [Pseudomonadota bacterium]
MSRYPLEGYRNPAVPMGFLGTRFAKNPPRLKIPITIAGMSFGSLSAKGQGGTGQGGINCWNFNKKPGGGMTPEEREQSETLVYQYLPSR